MKPATRAVGGIFVLVVLGGAVSAAAFVFVGSQIAVWSAVAIVPMLVVGGGLWVRNTIQTTGTSQTEYAERRAREVGEQFKEFWERRERVHEAHPDLFAGGDSLPVDSTIADLAENGIEFETDTGAFSLGNQSRGLEAINRLDGEIQSLENRHDEEFAERVRDDIDRINVELERIEAIVAVDPPVRPADVPHPDETDQFQWRSVSETHGRHRDWASETIDRAIDWMRSTLESTDDVDETTVTAELSDARSASSDGDYTTAIDHLLQARDVLSQTGDDVFQSAITELESLVRAVRASDALEHARDEHHDELESVEADIDGFDSAMDMDAVASTRAELRSLCLDMLERLSDDLSETLETLERADPPAGYFDRPDVADVEFGRELRETDDISQFERKWEAAIVELTEALDTLEPKAEVVNAYDQVADRIEEELRSSGTVTASDLPVREYESQFLGLYYRKNDGVGFDPDAPALTTGGGGETHALEATVRFETGGSERDVAVTLTGPDHEDERQVSTHLASTVSFTDVPFGEYTVRATPETEESESVSETITLDADTELRLEMADVTLRQQVCDGVDDPQAYLEELSDRFREELDAEGHLASTMSFPIDDSYVPCLLAVWADQEGYTATLADGTVLVYDNEALIKELENVIQYNLDHDETLSFDRLRETFISAPVPDETLESLVAASAESDTVHTGDGGITKEGK